MRLMQKMSYGYEIKLTYIVSFNKSLDRFYNDRYEDISLDDMYDDNNDTGEAIKEFCIDFTNRVEDTLIQSESELSNIGYKVETVPDFEIIDYSEDKFVLELVYDAKTEKEIDGIELGNRLQKYLSIEYSDVYDVEVTDEYSRGNRDNPPEYSTYDDKLELSAELDNIHLIEKGELQEYLEEKRKKQDNNDGLSWFQAFGGNDEDNTFAMNFYPDNGAGIGIFNGMTEDIEDSPEDDGKAFDDVSIEDIITLKVEQGKYIPEAVDYTDERIDDIIYNIIPLPQLSDAEDMEEYYYNRDLDKVFIVRQEDIE